ncbi:MAG: DUF342 domain-containing protein [Phycisphaeraceae bacterium]|nr:DUF342 domain-containing protein [Phycisphaeraceae bacterium]
MSIDALDKVARVSVSSDGLRATLQIQPGAEPGDITPEAVEAILAARGVRPSEVTTHAAAILSQALIERPGITAETIAAEGVPAVDGKDGHFELDAALVQEVPPVDTGEATQTGFSHYGRSAFMIVHEGQRIGMIHPHTDAQDGMDVRGKLIKAVIGRPCPLVLDDSVEQKPDGSVHARRRGRLEMTPSKLRVEPVLEISEFVDFSTGNVDFPGDVIIRKGVRDCFRVEVGGNLEVVELVEAADLHARGSIVLRRGMAGRGKGELVTGGNLEAKYLDGVRASIAYDLRIQKELTNCTTSVGRCIHSGTCTVVGGELTARFGGSVRSLGGEAETPTLVRIGIDPQLDTLARLLEEILPMAAASTAKAMQELQDLQKMAARLTATQAETMTSLQFDIMNGQAKVPAIRAGIEHVLLAYEKLHATTLLVEKTIMPGVVIQFAGHTATVREVIKGPIHVALDHSGAIVLRDPNTGSSIPLSAKAKLQPNPEAINLHELRRWLENNPLGPSQKAA